MLESEADSAILASDSAADLARAPWELLLPPILGPLPLGGTLVRTEPAIAASALITIVGLYPAHTKKAVYECLDGSRINLPIEVEGRSFEGSRSGAELAELILRPLRIEPADINALDLYPYYLANIRCGKNRRSMWKNVQRYHAETGHSTAVVGRPGENEMVHWCRTLPGNVDRLAHYIKRWRPRLVVTLGNEAAAFTRGYNLASQAQAHLYSAPFESDVLGHPTLIVHCAHPGLLMMPAARDAWMAKHMKWCLRDGRRLVEAALADYGSNRS